MIIGIDFDNTTISYDGVFYRAALERGLIPTSTQTDKTSVRDALREAGREDDWTELQGVVYGPDIGKAKPYDGVKVFMRSRLKAGDKLFIVSHKTRHPYLGQKFDLHEAAQNWLKDNGFFRADDVNLDVGDVFFEQTKEDKMKRIAKLGCNVFVDDLPEFLMEPAFPANVRRILFDPDKSHPQVREFQRMTSWHDAFKHTHQYATLAGNT